MNNIFEIEGNQVVAFGFGINITLSIKIMGFNFFKKKKVRFLGRGGLIFEFQNNDYLIDSEMSFSEKVDIIIFKDSIQLKSQKKSLSAIQKEEVLNSLLDYLKKKEHLKIEVI